MSLADWRKVLSINPDGTFGDRGICQVRARAQMGRVVNTASSTLWVVVTGFSALCRGKGGIIGFTRALASDLAR
jgi:NAD(P)-dependent dehydrogenase (short-subunit alcohol dehydrogenase family)